MSAKKSSSFGGGGRRLIFEVVMGTKRDSGASGGPYQKIKGEEYVRLQDWAEETTVKKQEKKVTKGSAGKKGEELYRDPTKGKKRENVGARRRERARKRIQKIA